MGIGGIGMSAIAPLLLRKNYKVSGCDLRETEIIRNLRRLGVAICIGHEPAHLEDVTTLVYSSAIKRDNPEKVFALEKGIRVLKRAQILATLMQEKTTITVTGMHGKTTTSSLIAYMLTQAGICPTVAIGGMLKDLESNVCFGEGEFFVAEADESDGTFLFYQPNYSIITNIDYEHMDYYKNWTNLLDAFRRFINQTDKRGLLIYCNDDLKLVDLVKDCNKKAVSFGLTQNADIFPKNIRLKKQTGLTSQFDCLYKGKFLEHFELNLLGAHNISNALSVIALGVELGIDINIIKEALAGFKGIHRRMEVKFASSDFLVIDDYGHHPSEIEATLKALRPLSSASLIVVFQPHRYSRTQLLFERFCRSFYLADFLIITDIYPAGEEPIAGIDSGLLCKRIEEREGPKVLYLTKEKIINSIVKIIKPGDVVLFLGAGDITYISDELARYFQG